MTEEKYIELEVMPVGPFYSTHDESAFFEWLDKIKSIKKYEGHFQSLYIKIDFASVSEEDLREIIAIFLRYDVDMKQLAIFDHPEFSDVLANWRDVIFGNKNTRLVKEEEKKIVVEDALERAAAREAFLQSNNDK